MHFKVSYTCWELSAPVMEGTHFWLGNTLLWNKAKLGPVQHHRVLVYYAYINKDDIIIGLYSTVS